MTHQRESRADLVLNPPNLGRIEVSITLNGDQASASFVSASAEVRDALQGSLPRLREVLADAGVFLSQANIGPESFQQGNGTEKGRKSADDHFAPAAASLLGSDEGSLASAAGQPASRGQGLIDLFA
jgi:flagellar hook-length control protein FliK